METCRSEQDWIASCDDQARCLVADAPRALIVQALPLLVVIRQLADVRATATAASSTRQGRFVPIRLALALLVLVAAQQVPVMDHGSAHAAAVQQARASNHPIAAAVPDLGLLARAANTAATRSIPETTGAFGLLPLECDDFPS